MQVSVGKPLIQIVHDESDDASDVLLRQRMEHDDLIQPVQEFRAEPASKLRHYRVFRIL